MSFSGRNRRRPHYEPAADIIIHFFTMNLAVFDDYSPHSCLGEAPQRTISCSTRFLATSTRISRFVFNFHCQISLSSFSFHFIFKLIQLHRRAPAETRKTFFRAHSGRMAELLCLSIETETQIINFSLL